jgi:anti-sigma B factor antagonist
MKGEQMSSELLTVDARQIGSVQVVTLAGELDLASGQGLPEVLADLPGLTLVVDLARLTFMDSSGISALVQARRRLGDRGTSLVLTRPRDRVSRTLEIVGLGDWISPWSPEWD